MNESSTRSYGLDALRVLLAIMVITLHFNAGGTGKVLSYSNEFPWSIIVGGVTTLCYPAVNCYVLLSGFFSWNKKAEVWRKLFGLWLSLLFFSLVGYAIVCIARGEFSPIDLVYRFLPLVREKWWYMVDYFALIIMSPYINKLIGCLSRTQHKKTIIICLVLFSIVPMMNNWNDYFGINYGYGLLWFATLYFIGSYMSKYRLLSDENNRRNRLQSPIIMFFCYLLLSGSVMIVDKLLRIFGIDFYLNPYNSLFSLLQSVFLFMAFANMKIHSKAIVIFLKHVAPLTLASYLFHCQEDMDVFLWQTIAPWQYANSNLIIIIYFATVLGIFFTSIALERIRIFVFGGVNKKIIKGIERIIKQ